MALYISALASGSNGNCYYISNGHEAVLVDVGIACRDLEQRMKRLGLSPESLKAIFVSHEHSDHIRGIPVFSRKYGLPIYITPHTLRYGRMKMEKSLIRSFSADEPVPIGALSVTAFSKPHDAADPYSFTITDGSATVGVFTDIGHPCSELVHHFSRCHAAFLESNYDTEMLEKGGYPYYLKNRIRGGRGHLSNAEALELFTTHRPPFMTHLILSHLSKNNNCPLLVQNLFTGVAPGVTVTVASRFEETPLFEIAATGSPVPLPLPHHRPSVPPQLSLAFD
ncbi:MAG TPA: MBL fold metallo-hydrolase [Chitinophagaceae bacterium]|jgi:phosphoribosyl 1,2-cyclic phosphodiesterase|nr:MBL fold metallo-hydrolase [Chitinophagaceae bacterium]